MREEKATAETLGVKIKVTWEFLLDSSFFNTNFFNVNFKKQIKTVSIFFVLQCLELYAPFQIGLLPPVGIWDELMIKDSFFISVHQALE